jgi:hypothetical protein
MKKNIIYTGLLSLVILFSCKKAEVQNPLADVKNLGIGSYLTLEVAGKSTLDISDFGPSEVGVTVDKYGDDVESVNVFVVKGANADPATWKKVKTVPFTGKGTSLALKGAEIIAALGGSDFEAGDYFTFYNQAVTKDGRTFDVSNMPGAIESNSNYNSCMRWAAYITCPFKAPMAGSYSVITDDWADWVPGDVVQVADGPGENQIDISQIWPNPDYGSVVDPLIVTVDPATGVATVANTTFGDYGALAIGQGAGEGNNAGYVLSCTGDIILKIAVTYNGSSQGDLKLVLKKL